MDAQILPPKGWRMPAKPTTPEWRNVALFRLGIRWCGYPSNWGNVEGVQAVIEAANARLDLPLFAGELMDIVKSVIKISRKNLASGQRSRISASFRRLGGDDPVRRGAREHRLNWIKRHGKVKTRPGRRGIGTEQANTLDGVAARGRKIN